MLMRLMLLTELFLPTKGGTAVWSAEVYSRLGGKEIHIITADVPGAEDVDTVHPNSIHRLNLKRVPWLRPESLAMYTKFLLRAFRLAVTRRFDAIHAMRALPEGLVAWLVARLTFRPVVIYAHGEELTTWGKGGKYKAMRFALRHADKVIANSDFTRDELIRMGVAQESIALVSPGVDIQRFRPGLRCDDLKASIGLEREQKLILSVGRLQRRKGFDMVLRSLLELVHMGVDVKYALIGTGEDFQYLRDLAEGIGVSDRVTLLGHVEPDDLPRWYNASDVFVMANREINGDTEGFGMVFLEAAACGKPTIAGTAGGTGAAVVHGVTGYRVNGAEQTEVTEALRKLLSDKNLAGFMGREGLSRTHSEFSWDRVADKTKRLVGSVR